jgi:hypothetical protein
VGTLSASWSAYDPDSVITLYSYAIGTTPGGGEVVNWTNTMATSFTRTGLGLIAGHTYYISVKARNEGGLWSEAGTPAGLVAGSGTCTTNNTAPVADAGIDQNVTVNALVTLDGSGSYDPDGHLPLSYSWQQTGGTAVVLNGSTTDHPTFTAPAVPSVLAFALSVTDAFGLSDLTPDQVKVTVSLSGKWLVHLPVVMRNW